MCLNRRVTWLLWCIYNLNTEKSVIEIVIFGYEGCRLPLGPKSMHNLRVPQSLATNSLLQTGSLTDNSEHVSCMLYVAYTVNLDKRKCGYENHKENTLCLLKHIHV